MKPAPVAVLESVASERIVYQRGTVYTYLTGYQASLYRGMIWMYGKAEATERFWWLWHKKAVTVPQQITAQTL